MSKENPLGIAIEATPAPTPPQIPSLTRPEGSHGGTWGEHNSPEPVSVSRGLHRFEQLARDTSRLGDDEEARNGSRPGLGNVLSFGRSTTKVNSSADIESHPGVEGTFGESPHEHPENLSEAQADVEGGFDLRQWIENRNSDEESQGKFPILPPSLMRIPNQLL